MTAGGIEPLTPAQRRAAEARAGAGDVEAMLQLAFHAENRDRARGWYARAGERGHCHAIRMLNDDYDFGRRLPPAERRRWAAADWRLGCGVHRWRTAADGAALYVLPDDSLWRMRVGCVGGAAEIAGPAGSTPSEMPRMIYRTSRGAQPRAIGRVRHNYSAVAFAARPGDEVLAALLRGERIEVEFPGGQPWTVDGRGAAPLLRPLLARCGPGRPP